MAKPSWTFASYPYAGVGTRRRTVDVLLGSGALEWATEPSCSSPRPGR